MNNPFRNKIRWLAAPVPFLVLWVVFIVGHALDMKADAWWAMPYIITSLGVLMASIISTILFIDHNHY